MFVHRNTINYNNVEKVTNTVDLILDGNSSQNFTTTLIINKPIKQKGKKENLPFLVIC